MDYGYRNPRAAIHEMAFHLVDCGSSWNAAAGCVDFNICNPRAAAMHKSNIPSCALRLVHCGRCLQILLLQSTRWNVVQLMDCGSCIAATTIHELLQSTRWIINSRGLRQLVNFRAVMRRNISPFVRSHF